MSAPHVNVDGWLEDLRKELSTDPSPDFEHRVRSYVLDGARSRSAHVRSEHRLVGRQSLILIGMALAAGLILLVRVSNAADSGSRLPIISAAARAVSPLRALPMPDAAASAPALMGAAASGRSPAAAMSSARATDWEYDVIVPPDQLEVLTRLLETMRQKRMAWTPGPSATAGAEPLADPEPIEIAPIRIEPVPVLLPVSGERKQ